MIRDFITVLRQETRVVFEILAREALERISPHLPAPPVIMGTFAYTPYLSRYYLVDKSEALPLSVYLHHFHRDDDDEALHNHPWAWACSLVLAGGYEETRREPDGSLSQRMVRPFSINVLRHDDYHRVRLIDADAWSLFITGPRISSWSFWDPRDGTTTPWQEFLSARQEREAWRRESERLKALADDPLAAALAHAGVMIVTHSSFWFPWLRFG